MPRRHRRCAWHKQSYAPRSTTVHPPHPLMQNFLALQGTFELARAKLTPRRKFRFSDKARARLRARREAGQGAATAASRSATEEASRRLATESEAAMAALAAEEVLVSGKQGESIIVGGDSGASKGNDMRLADLKDCTVLMCVTACVRRRRHSPPPTTAAHPPPPQPEPDSGHSRGWTAELQSVHWCSGWVSPPAQLPGLRIHAGLTADPPAHVHTL